MSVPSLLTQRRSTPSRLLGAPGPDDATLRAILAEAVRVPDHGKLVPWRFLRIEGDFRHELGTLLARRSLERDPAAAPAVVEKDRQRFSHAPVVVAVVSRPVLGHKVPEIEQVLSGGAVCFALLLAAQVRGFGGQWLTGWAAYDPAVLSALGLTEGEAILGFIHLGTVTDPVPERQRPEVDALLTDWRG